jgi:pimeloyl-ACP methyl ester carboxylesterase
VVDFYDLNVTRHLEQIDVPALFIGFGRDAIVDPALTRAVADSVATSEFVDIPEFSHFSMMEMPEKLANLISGFFDRQEAEKVEP